LFLSQYPSLESEIKGFLRANNNSEEAKNKVKSALEILSLPELSNNNTPNTFKNRILRMAAHLKQWGNPEDEIFADYIEGITLDFNKMTVGDVFDIYKLTKAQVHDLTKKYFSSIIIPVAEAAYPFVVYALTEATLGAALPLISRIPLAVVIRGKMLEKMVRQIAKLGSAGTNSHIRMIPKGNYLKSLEIFKKITKNAKSIKVETLSNGRVRRIADMGNGNYITFRNYDYSNTPGLVANIDLNFPKIWSKIRELKFIK
ncbi:hypothetical protein ACQY1Q_17230, partial [Tenacibaculum sp. TC6]|uniref:hypothetical protein n=1 Tax=Tenacibaculum sp. TC6 TaxID=3423223 RepID=UPI003D368C04